MLHLLYLTPSRCEIWRASGRQAPVFLQNFALTVEGLRGMRDWLQQRGTQTCRVLVDLPDEDFQAETIPVLGGWDRRALIARKQLQYHRLTAYRMVISQGRVIQNGRKQEQLLLLALTETNHLDSCLRQLDEAQWLVSGVYSVAQLAPILVEKLMGRASRALLVGVYPDGTMRQTFVTEHGLRLSRQQLSPGEPSGTVLRDDTDRTVQYLQSLRQISATETLPVWVLGDRETLAVIQDRPFGNDRLQFSFVDVENHASPIFTQALSGVGLVGMWLSILAKSPPASQYAPPIKIHRWLARRFARQLLTLGVASLLLCAGVAAYFVFDALSIETTTQTQTRQLHLLETEASALYPGATIYNAAPIAQGVVAVNDLATKRWPSPVARLIGFSQVMNRFPEIALDRVDWQLAPPVAGDQAVITPVKNTEGIQWPAVMQETFTVEGHLVPFNGDYRRALALVQRFVDALHRQTGAEVVLTTAPVDVTISGTFASQPAATQGAGRPVEVASARFVLEVRVKQQIGSTSP